MRLFSKRVSSIQCPQSRCQYLAIGYLKFGLFLCLIFVPAFISGPKVMAAPTTINSQERSLTAPVVAHNQTQKTVTLVGRTYIDGWGREYAVPQTWDIKPGENVFLLFNSRKIEGQKFYYWVVDDTGPTYWVLSLDNNYSEGQLVLTITDSLLARHAQNRKKVVQNAVGKIVTAVIAHAVATSGNSEEDDFGDILLRIGAIGIRNGLIQEAVADVFPLYSRTQKATVQRVIQLMFEGRLNPENYRRESRRDALMQALKQEAPDLAGAAEFYDFIEQLQQARSQARR